MSYEHTFTSTTLEVAIPDTSLDFPSHESIDTWLDRVRLGSVDRNQTFFDEQLYALLIVRIKQPAPEADAPPQHLLAFLAHLQVSFEATYISPVPDVPQDSRVTLASPPRGSSLSKLNPRLSLHPSILPPNTPNPTPAAAEHDRKYVTSEGTILLAGIWGQSSSQDAKEGFTLLWSSEEQLWVAIYSFSLTVSFIRLSVPDPLLCLTVSATLRDKPITTASSKHPLASFFAKLGSQSTLIELDSLASPNGDVQEDSTEAELHGFEEVNLLQGLHAGPTFGTGTAKVTLPSTRLGIVSRQKLFSLAPINLPTPEPPEPSPMTALRTVHPTLRKSFRKTLHTVSGFRVRMRTVFVPYVLLPRRASSTFGAISDDGEDERDKREAGNEERTVVLCIEIENSGESGPHVGFQVEKVDVSVSGDDAEAHLIGWNEASIENAEECRVFPLQIDAHAQYNLLYAVWFLHPPDELKGPMLGRAPNAGTNSDLQRAVAIYVHGKPYEKQYPQSQNGTVDSPCSFLYPTQTFASRWNCILDLGAHDSQNPDLDPPSSANRYPNVLPEPASPFPLSGSRAGGFFSEYSSPSTAPRSGLIAGTQRFSLPNRTVSPPFKTSHRYSDQTPTSSNRSAYVPPSQSFAAAAQFLHSPTTYAPVFSPGFRMDGDFYLEQPPLTPAYPPHSPHQPSPTSQGPITAQGVGMAGPSVETKRERGSGLGLPSSGLPMTPTLGANRGVDLAEQQGLSAEMLQKLENGESVVVSVRLMSPRDQEDLREAEEIDERIYPLSKFTIEVFVFNRSAWTRRFELSCPSFARMKRKERVMSQYGVMEKSENKLGYAGILPVDNRVRIGPLLPSACQTVRMRFLAVTPGVHSIDALTLTDIESGHAMNLRSVMDVVVHEMT
ncbi:hypothetical protein APHAL10511_007291 [Amanita phalloides]|nr:hypothetical protein APHAL10511_007291 [Amanita phalloides]